MKYSSSKIADVKKIEQKPPHYITPKITNCKHSYEKKHKHVQSFLKRGKFYISSRLFERKMRIHD